MPGDIQFGSTRGALEYYYNFHGTEYRGIDYEIVRVDKSTGLDTRHIDTFSTIGFYICRLDAYQKYALACFFVGRKNYDTISHDMSRYFQKSIMGQQVKTHVFKAIRYLDQRFKRIGIVEDRGA